MRFLLIATLMLSFTAYAQEESSREFADGVIELTTVKVKTNFLQNYLDGIETVSYTHLTLPTNREV